MKTIDFIVLNWKDEASTLLCIDSIKALKGDYQKHIIIVNNEGTPETQAALLHDAGTPLTIVNNRRNLGFSGGVNSALPYLKGSLVALINNDCVIDPDWLITGVDQLEDQAIGLVGGREFLWDATNPPYQRSNSYTLLPVIDPSNGWVHHVIDAKTARTDLPFITANNVLTRGDVFKRLAGFDDHFFAYYEDVDLCARIIDLGYTIGFTPKMMAWHRGSQTSNRVPYVKIYYSRRNPCLVISKHFDGPWLRTVTRHALSEVRNGAALWLRRRSNENRLLARGGVVAGLWVIINLPRLAYRRWAYRRRLNVKPVYYGKLCDFYDHYRDLTQRG